MAVQYTRTVDRAFTVHTLFTRSAPTNTHTDLRERQPQETTTGILSPNLVRNTQAVSQLTGRRPRPPAHGAASLALRQLEVGIAYTSWSLSLLGHTLLALTYPR